MSLQAIASMGGYGAYIWPAYGLAAVILGGMTLNAVLRYRSAKRRLQRLQEEHSLDRS